MRVALFMDAPRIGGAERYFGDLAGGLADAGLEVHAITSEDALLPYLSDRVGDRVRIHTVGSRPRFDGHFGANLGRAVRPLAATRAALHRIDPDLVHLSNGGFPGSHLCRAAALVTRRPCVMTVNCRAQERRLSVHAAHDRMIWGAVDRVITPARATADSLVELRGAPPDLLRVVHYGIEAPRLDVRVAEQLRADLAPEAALLVGMVAAPSTNADIVYKGHHVLLEALAATGREDIHAVVVGHDPGPSWRARADSLGLARRVTVVPGYQDAAPYMRAFDVLTVPSTRNEALPLVILEAMVSGTPVLASRLSGIREAVVDGHSGHTFDPGDAPALGHLLANLAGDRSELGRLSGGARARWREHFSLARMIDETVSVYDECAPGPAREGAHRPTTELQPHLQDERINP